jgi:hypothetical protein
MIFLAAVGGQDGGAAGAASVVILLFGFPLLGWFVFAKVQVAKRVFWWYAHLWTRFTKGYYFEKNPKTVHGVERRTLELLLSVVGMSAYFVEKVTIVTVRGSLFLFVVPSIAVLVFSGFALITIWVYEDAGFRAHSVGSTTLGIPFNWVKGFLVYGGVASYLSFSLAYGGSLQVSLIFTGVLVIAYGGICYLLTTLFHDRWAKRAVDEVRNWGTVKGMPLKSMSVA